MTAAPSASDRVSDLLQALTLDEKLQLCAGQSLWKTKAVGRLGIGPFKLTDGPRGVGFHSSGRRCTAFPSGIAQAASWDEALMHRFGEALGQECRAVGGRTILGPAINITRTPLNGRTFEYLSEDPYLNSRLVVPIVKAVQGQGVAACVKHFAANNQETSRMRVSAEVSERALQEIYLPAFRAAVEQGDAWSIMAAYNAVNGTPACENADLLKTKLREEWGFKGFVVTDWFAARSTSSSAACVKGGLSLEMPGKGSRYRYKNLSASHARAEFTETELDDNLRGLLYAMVMTGHIDPPPQRGVRNTPEHQTLAREMAEAGMTLLKNDGDLLPLDTARIKKVCAIGPKIKKRNCLPLWGGSAGVWPPYELTPWQGLQQENHGRFEWVAEPENADAVLLFIGLSHRPGLDSEVKDRKRLGLSPAQDQLVRDTVKANPNTAVVLINGSPIAMPWVADVPAILECWYPGMEGGAAIARTLFGDNNPSGKLPVTFPRALNDSPAHASERTFPGNRRQVHYNEELLVGYRHFDKFNIEPLFPFGHGLSYTQFEYRELTLSAQNLSSEEVLTMSFTLANTGRVAGAEVVQLYVADLAPGDDRPPQSLKGFQKVGLEPGESQQVSLLLSMAELLVFCPQSNQWQVKPGAYSVRVGSSSRDIRLEANFSLGG
jgi:beta-glucosidase